MKRYWRILCLSIVLLASLWRLAGWTARFASESLQMDFAAFYTAGEALNHGLSPYRNHAAHEPVIWDGVDLFQHSRFLYPPQVAVLFRPLAWLPYATAKRLWSIASLTAVAASLILTARVFTIKRNWNLILVVAISAALFYPLLTHLERGQIDAVTLLLITLASVKIGKRTSRAEFTAGVLLCAATLLKLHCVFIVPFLALRGKGRVLLGYLAGGLLIAALTIVAPGGIEGTWNYVTEELPRISRFGEWGTDDMRLPPAILEAHRHGLPDDATIKDGVIYKRESFRFFSNGTLVRVLQRYLQRAEIWLSNSQLSIMVFAALFGVMVVWQTLQPRPVRFDARGEMLYWLVVALIVLLSAPLTWVMNLVWLLPLIVVVIAEMQSSAGRWKTPALIVAAAALVIIALPDGIGAPWMMPFLTGLMRNKYVTGESLLLIALLFYRPQLHSNLIENTNRERESQ